MKITQVVVEIHEKRNHPTGEYSHFDSSVSYTAQVDEDDVAEDIVEILQFQARLQVADECARWVNGILTREAQESARRDLQWIVDRLENRLPDDRDAEQFKKHVEIVPFEERGEWWTKLGAAKAEYLERIKRDLDRIVERVARRGATARDEADIGELIPQLPESERQGYIDKMSDAVAAYELGQAPLPGETQVESKSSGDKEEIPF